MPLPELIQIQPLPGPVSACVAVPGSKSVTNRALVLAALAHGTTTLHGALWSEDTRVMVEALRAIGIRVDVCPDPTQLSNRAITVWGCGGRLPHSSGGQPIELYVGNAGTAARFLTALVCLGDGTYRLHGTPRMHQRPQGALFKALRSLGYVIDSPNDRLPAAIHGAGPRAGHCAVAIGESSQFASALLLAGAAGGWTVELDHSGGPEDASYIEMTRQMIASFPRHGGEFAIEPDASSGSYFIGAAWLLGATEAVASRPRGSPTATLPIRWVKRIAVDRWPSSGWQIDARFPDYLPLPRSISRARDLGDSVMTAMVLAADGESGREWRPDSARVENLISDYPEYAPLHFTDLGRLRLQECERVAALRCELERCGGAVTEFGDTLEVRPTRLHGAAIETYDDHRMAMCFSILGLKVPGVRIKNPACVKKTFPDFYLKLGQPPPTGLGAAILDGQTGHPLAPEQLLAE